MGMEAKGFEWTCDWCRSTVNNDDGDDLPDGWTTPRANGELEYLEQGVFCKEECCVNYVKLDHLLGPLYREVERSAMHHFKGKDTVPDDIEIRVLLEILKKDAANTILEPPDRP